MSQQVLFIRAFAQLVWLQVYRSGDTPAQKLALRGAMLETREAAQLLSLTELNRAIAAATEMSPTPHELPWLNELASRMASHSVGTLEFAQGAKASDVLGVARVLATSGVQGDEGANVDARLLALQLTTVTVRLGRAGFVRRGTPIGTSRVGRAPLALTRALGTLASDDAVATREMGIGASTHALGGDGDATSDDRRDEQELMVEAAFSRHESGAKHGDDEWKSRLEGILDGTSAAAVLDEMSRVVEDSARDGQWVGVVELLHQMVGREASVADGDMKRAFLIRLRRLFKPGILRGVAQLLARRRELRADIEAILVRAGDAGAEVLIELLVSSNVTSERRAYRTAIVHCPAAATPLSHLMEDNRWYVVRNAAELLGEMGVQEADGRLIAALRHGDARVRRSAAGALARLGTTRGIYALHTLLSDPNTAVRLQAVHGMAAARLPRSVPSLLQALEREEEPDLQHAILAALGAHPTDAAIDRLSLAAQPGSLLNRKPTPFRAAAVNALGEAATPAALATLRSLQGDKDRVVRAAVERALVGQRERATAGR